MHINTPKLQDKATKFREGFHKVSELCWSFFHKHFYLIFAVCVTVFSFVFRYFLTFYTTKDMVDVIGWLQEIRSLGFNHFYEANSDYSSFFLFLVAILAYLPEGPMTEVAGYTFPEYYMAYLKMSLFALNIVTAYGLYLLVKELTKSKANGILAYCIYLVMPFEWFISSIWGNFDAVYTCTFPYIIYFLLKGKDGWSWFFFGLSICVKLQGFFIFPFMVVMVLYRKIKLWKCVYAGLALLLTLLPMWFCGGFLYSFQYVARETVEYPVLNSGSANLWQIFPYLSEFEYMMIRSSLWIGLSILGVAIGVIYSMKLEMNNENIMGIACFISGLVPFVLPHMHERYFYFWGALLLAYVFLYKKRFYLIIFAEASSFIACAIWISNKYFIQAFGADSVSLGSYFNLFVLAVLFYGLLQNKKTQSSSISAL